MPVWEQGAAPHGGEVVRRPWLVHRPGQGWDLLYAVRVEGTWYVCRAVTAAKEPRNFRPVGPPLGPGREGSGEEAGVRSPCGLATDDGRLLVVYAGIGRDNLRRPALFSAWAPQPEPGRVGVSPVAPRFKAAGSPVDTATASALAWQRLGLLLPAGRAGDADAGGCDHPAMLRVGRRHWLWYTADDGLGKGCRIAAASWVVGGTWRRHGVVLGRGAPGQPDEAGAEAPGVLAVAGRIEMVYTGWGPSGARLLRARSTDGLSFDRLGPLAASGPREGSLAFGPDGRGWLAAVVDDQLAIAAVDL